MITRQAFQCIYVNANSLTELALRNLSSDLDSLLDDVDDRVPIDNADLPVDLETNLEDLNFAAIDGLEFYDPEVESHFPEPEITLPAKNITLNNQIEKDGEFGEEIDDFDIETYMNNVYLLAEQLSERIDSAYQQIEHAQIRRLLNLLPPELPPIDGKLSGENMTLWLEQYVNDVESITNILVAIRQLDFT
ncbi:MAG: hypothetical protein JKY14_12570 [Paraglaciecola sp.]|nr:hypothetical protein [Paraglaciecola sp.]